MLNSHSEALIVETITSAVNGVLFDSQQLLANLNRPHVYMRPTVEVDTKGNWTCWYDCVIGRGSSPQAACCDFDKIWLGQESKCQK